MKRIAHMNRRSLLKAMGLGLAASSLPGRMLATHHLGTLNADVVVIGGGISGLTTARRLVEAGVSDVIVLEAKDRVGGRTVNKIIQGDVPIEGGGQWVGPTQTAILDLADELGVGTYPSYTEGSALMMINGRAYRVDDIPMKGWIDHYYSQFEAQINALAQSIPLDSPWTAPGAQGLDAISLRQWLEAEGVDDFLQDMIASTCAMTLGPAEQVSMLYFLFYVHSAGGLDQLSDWEGGAQDSRIEGGSQIIPLLMAEALGDRVLLNSPVSSIDTQGEGVIVESQRATVRAKRIVIAMMPKDIHRIAFRPLLPADRMALNENWPAQPGVKAEIVYKTPFWRERGLSGEVWSEGRIAFVADNTPPGVDFGVLVAFAPSVGFPDDINRRQRLIVNALTRYLGPEAAKPIEYVDVDWQKESWISGCVCPVPPGLTTQYGYTLRQPIGPIHWAGTETSPIWCGYMDGAVRAGERAAQEVLDALGI